MDNFINSYKNIYPKILDEIDALLCTLEVDETDDETVDITKSIASEKLTSIHKKLEQDIVSLESNSEWDAFSIAFYGETNAGKSTLIETLRILLKEETKLKERELFEESAIKYNKLKEDILVNQNEISSLELRRQQFINEFNESLSEYELQKEDLEIEYISLELQICILNEKVIHLMIDSIKNFFISTFYKLEEQKQINLYIKQKDEIKIKLQQINNSIADMKNNFNEVNNLLDDKLKKVLQSTNNLKLLLEDERQTLIDNQDGRNINSELDFTKKVINYEFKYEGNKFLLMDLPGIEGKEEDVQEEINNAIKKAHVVLYISRTARTPQNGDNDGGTIGKIMKQLSNQTEIYFVFNKPARTPKHLKKEIEDLDVSNSLNEVDSNLKYIFNERYRGHISLSAYPVFISICNTNDTGTIKSKDKFLSTFTKEELLKISNMDHFIDWIKNDLVNEVKIKIIKSNINKVNTAILSTVKDIEDLNDSFKELYDKVNTNLVYTKKALIENNLHLYKNTMNIIHKHISEFKNNSRKEAYVLIEDGINNEKLNNELKKITKRNQKKLNEKLAEDMKIITKKFESEQKSIIEKYGSYFEDLLNLYENTKHIDFKSISIIRTKSKINIVTILGEITILISNIVSAIAYGKMVAIVVAVIGGIGLLISVGKEIYGYFDDSFMMSQQRKSVDDALEKICKQIEDESQLMLDKINDEMELVLNDIVSHLNEINNSILFLCETFDDSKRKLLLLHRTMQIPEVK